MKKDEKFYDVRVYERHIKEGNITEKDHEKYLKSLPDVSDKSEFLIVEDKEENEEESS